MSIGLQCFAQTPVITSISPAAGPAGITVVISGANFGTAAAANTVYFGAAKATVSTASASSLTVVVPPGATYMPVTVTANGLTAYSPRPFLLTFAGTGNFSAASFDPPVNEATDLHPNGLVMADFDGDGHTDLATPNNYSISGSLASISIPHNQTPTGAIAFGQVINVPTGVLTDGLAAGDINGDGKPDLVSVSVQAGMVSIFLNGSSSGDIIFTAGPSYTTGTSPSAVAVYDLDGDGRPDILVLNQVSGTLSVFRNTTSGGVVSFANRVDFGTGLFPTGIAVGDLDGDGKADVAVVNNLANTVSFFRNTSTAGTIALATKVDMATTAGTDNPYGVEIADMDGDGKADLIVSNNNVTTTNSAVVSISVFRNTSSAGSFSFAGAVNFGSGNSYEIAVGDLNGDGKPDVVVPVMASNNMNVYVNSGSSGTISLVAPVVLTSGSPYAPGIGDLDGDGIPDIAVSNFTLSSVSIFRSRVLQPTITGVSPLTAFQGDTVTITGFNFTGCTYATIDNIGVAYFKVVSDTKIIIVVGDDASGDVDVTGPHGSGTFPGFVYSAPPTIQSFSPTSAGEGQTVTIVGTNFIGVTGVSFWRCRSQLSAGIFEHDPGHRRHRRFRQRQGG